MCYMSAGRRVGVRELRQNLSVYLTRVRRGETFTVTDRRQIAAVLAPAARGEDALAHLVAEGRAAGARRSPAALPKPLSVHLDRPLSRIVRDLGDDVV
jgi:antitoxin (DNA-binding transcriptional repressor) of toxin-antitoxin stability system